MQTCEIFWEHETLLRRFHLYLGSIGVQLGFNWGSHSKLCCVCVHLTSYSLFLPSLPPSLPFSPDNENYPENNHGVLARQQHGQAHSAASQKDTLEAESAYSAENVRQERQTTDNREKPSVVRIARSNGITRSFIINCISIIISSSQPTSILLSLYYYY